MMEMAKDNSSNTMDIGWYGTINSSGEKYVGVFYDASSGVAAPEFHIGLGTVEPSSTAAWTVKGKLVIGALDATTGVFSGQVTIPATPVASTDAASKGYVDAQITAQDLDIAGDSGTGAVDLDSQTFTISGGTNVTTSVSGQTVTINASGGIDGSGTANDVVMWQDSDTLTDAPIAISGNNATFAGDVTIDAGASSTLNIYKDDAGNGKLSFYNDSTQQVFLLHDTADNFYIHAGSGSAMIISTNGATTLTLDTSNNATFAGNIGLGNATSPNRLLHIDNTPNATKASAYFYTNAIHTGTTTQAHVSIYSDNSSSTGQTLFVRGDGTGDLFVLNKGGTNKLVVDDDGNATFAGNVTISKAAPTLLVQSTSGGAATLEIGRTADTEAKITAGDFCCW